MLIAGVNFSGWPGAGGRGVIGSAGTPVPAVGLESERGWPGWVPIEEAPSGAGRCPPAPARRALAAPPHQASHWLRLGGGVSAGAFLPAPRARPQSGASGARATCARRCSAPIRVLGPDPLSPCCPGRSVRGH